MKKALAVAAILLTFGSSAFAAPPPGASTGHPHHSHNSSSHRVHVGPSHPMHTLHAPWLPSFFRSCGAACLRASVPAASAPLALRRLLRTSLRLSRCMVWVSRTLLLSLSLWNLLPQILCISRHPHQRETIKCN